MAKKNVLTAGKKAKADQAARAGDHAGARSLYAAVCKADPLDVEAWAKLALIEKGLGDFDEAERCARRAVVLAPQLGYAHYALAQALHARGERNAACVSYRAVLGLMPELADAHYLLGLALHELGVMADALVSLREAVRLRPLFVEALAELGAVHLDLGEVDLALDCLRRAAVLRPNDAAALGNIAHALRLQGENQAALAGFRDALRLAPDNVDLMAGLASLLEKSGSVDEAQGLVTRGLQLSAGHVTCNLVAAQLDRRGLRLQEAADRLEALLGQGLAVGIEAQVMLELGQVLDQMGDSERAFPLFVDGKCKKAMATLGGDVDMRKADYLAGITRSREQATPDLARVLSEQRALLSMKEGRESASPVFLIGFPRSGTTLLEQILDSHPVIQAIEEKSTVAVMAQRALEMLSEGRRTLADLDESAVAELRACYFEEVARHVTLTPGTTLLDKMPLNTVEVPLIARVFPDAHFILAIRHPCDVCLSGLMQDFATNAGMASFFSLDDAANLYVQVMDSWQRYADVLPLSHCQIRYEDLIMDVPGESRRLLDFLGLPWDDAVLAHREHAIKRSAINTPSYHQVVQPVYQRAKYRWKRYEEKMAGVMPLLQPFIERFDYA